MVVTLTLLYPFKDIVPKRRIWFKGIEWKGTVLAGIEGEVEGDQTAHQKTRTAEEEKRRHAQDNDMDDTRTRTRTWTRTRTRTEKNTRH
jgi:hypothetical protein